MIEKNTNNKHSIRVEGTAKLDSCDYVGTTYITMEKFREMYFPNQHTAPWENKIIEKWEGEQKMFTQKLSKKDFDLIRFHDGEFKLVALKTINDTIDWKYGDTFANGEKLLSPSEELVALLQLDAIVSKLGSRIRRIAVLADFLPFKRQDKDKLIGEIKFNGVYQLISHFDLIEFAPHDSNVFKPSTCDKYKEAAGNVKFIVFPDCGAQHRFVNYDTTIESEVCRPSWECQTIITFDKVRDANTGELKFADRDLSMVKGQDVVIFDDIIAYGGTFKHVASKLKEAGATNVKLIVNHADRDLNGKLLYNAKEMKEAGVDEIVLLNGGL